MKNKLKIYVLAGVGVAIGMALAIFVRASLDDGSPPPSVPTIVPLPADEAPVPPSVAEIVERHFQWAQEQEASGLAPQLVPIQEFFNEARLGTRAFAEDALGWDSKWKYVSDYLAGGAEHRKYLEAQFAARVFTPEALEQVVEHSVAAYLNHLDSVDAGLLVNLKADLEAIPAGSYSGGIRHAAIQDSLNTAIQQAMQATEADIPGMIGREIVSYIAGEVLSVAAVELATSAGILTAGASSGAMTVGVGIIVGVIVDQIVSWVYDEIYDPAGELSRQLDATLFRLEELIVAGDGDNPGLHHRLWDYTARRGIARNTAIISVVMPETVSQ